MSAALLVALSLLITIFDGVDMMSSSYLAPYIRSDLSLSKIALGGIFSAGPTGMIAGGFLFSYIGDRHGRRPGIIFACFAFGLLTLGMGLARTGQQLLCLRFLDGVALGGMLPLICVLNIEAFPQHSRATVVTIVMVGYSIGSSLAGPITNALAPRHGWPSVYFLAGAATLALGAALIRWLPESARYLETKAVRPLDPRPNAISRGVQAAGGHAGKGFRPARLFQGGMAQLTLLLWLAYLASTFSVYFLSNWGPTVFEDMGLARAHAASLIATSTLLGAVAGLALMRFTDRIGPAAVAVYPALTVPILALIGLGWMPRSGIEPFLVILAALVHGGHFGVISLAGLFYPTPIRANGAGWATSVAKIGGAAAPAVAGFVLATGVKPAHALGWLAICPLLLAICVAGLGGLGAVRALRTSSRRVVSNAEAELPA